MMNFSENLKTFRQNFSKDYKFKASLFTMKLMVYEIKIIALTTFRHEDQACIVHNDCYTVNRIYFSTHLMLDFVKIDF